MKRFLLLVMMFLLLSLLTAELVFRFVIPASNSPLYVQMKDFMVLHFDTNQTRDGLYTKGRLAQTRVPWHINNAGWNSQIEYLPKAKRTKPLIAIIGASEVEGMNIPWEEHFSTMLATRLRGKADVYTFGVGGIPMSQCILILRYLEAEFQPDWVVLLTSTLRDNSADLNRKPYTLQFRRTGSGQFEQVPPQDKQPSLGRFLLASASLRYVMTNAGVTFGMAKPEGQAAAPGKPKNPAKELAEEQQTRELLRHILGVLYRENASTRFLFVVDGPRKQLYNGEQNPSSLPMALALRDATAELGGLVVDMCSTFTADYLQHHEMLNFPYDYHWNARAHQLVAQEMARFFATVPLSPTDSLPRP
jgi:hypothetical protein